MVHKQGVFNMKFKLSLPKKNSLFYAAFPAIMIAALIIMTVYKIKGIFPFGGDSVAYMDMWQMNVPIYYHIYDFLHGDKSLFYDFYSGLGINMSESVAICSLLSPFNLFFYFIKRDAIMNFLPIYTMLKIEFSVLFMSIFLKYKFKNTHFFWINLASLAYGFCGMSMMYCTNSQWLDMAAFLPLLMMALDYSLKNKKVVPYALMMAFYCIVNPYIATISLMFIFFIASAYIILIIPKSDKALSMLHLGIGTLCGIGMSAFIILPFMNQTSKTARVGGSIITTIKTLILSSPPETAPNVKMQKYWMMWATALALAIIIYGVVINWRKARKNTAAILCVAFVTVQLFFENVNLIFHGGSYVLFPMRFGFITAFVMWVTAISYVNDIAELNEFPDVSSILKNKFLLPFKILFAIICAALIPLLSSTLAKRFCDMTFEKRTSFSLILFLILTVTYLILINRNNPKFFRGFICTMLCAEVAAGTYLFIGKPFIDPSFGSGSPDMKFAQEINDAADTFKLTSSKFSRVKNADARYTSNYPILMKKSALSNWTHSVDAKIQTAFKNLGYTIIYTRLVDTGGTVFFDSLMNVDDVITMSQLPEKSYTYVDSLISQKPAANTTVNHYKTNYSLGFGTVMSDSALNIPMSDAFTMQNGLFNAIDGDNNLFHIIQSGTNIDPAIITQKTSDLANKTVNYSINVSGCQNLYLAGCASLKININGKDFMMPEQGNENYNYPTGFNNGIVDLGVFENETVNLVLTYTNAIDENYLSIALMDYSKLDNLKALKSNYSTKITEEHNGSFELKANAYNDSSVLLLPLSYDKGIVCKVNGKTVETSNVVGCMTAVRLKQGENTVSVKYVPTGFIKGLIIAAIAALILAAYNIFLLKRNKVKFNGTVETILLWEYIKLWIIAVVIIYFVPMFFQLLDMFKNK